MTYVMSDIHGEYDKYKQMLELINFNDKDDLYILGDIVDRGDNPIKLLQDMMVRTNVFPIMGNHDLHALYILKDFCVEVNADNIEEIVTKEMFEELLEWLEEGGRSTFEQFSKLDKEQRADILEYILEFPVFDTVDIGDKSYIFTHAGLGNFRKDKKLSEYTDEELLLFRKNPDVQYFDDESIYLVWGHTPTRLISGKDEIYKSHNNILIDCGASMGGKLACLCLDTMEEFYV